MKIIRLILLLSAIPLTTLSINAQNSDSQRTNNGEFYVGTHAAMAVAESNFNSFGANKFHPGWDAGLNAGYQFTNIWSLELSASWSKVTLEEQDCCLSHNYILGNDLNRYYERNIIPEGVIGQYYKNIMSKVFVQRYGLQVNFNVLGLFRSMNTAPFRLELSPAIYAANTKASILTKSDKVPMANKVTAWHLGYGGQLFASYAVTDNIYMGIYGTYTQYVGRPIDGLPRVHSTNYSVDAGVKFVYTFGNKKSTIVPETSTTTLVTSNTVAPVTSQEAVAQEVSTQTTSSQEAESQKVPSSKVSEATPNTLQTADAEIKEQQRRAPTTPNEKSELIVKEQEVATAPHRKEEFSFDTPYPIIHFSFNSIWIESSERVKIRQIAKALNADSSIRVRVTAWGDEVGGNNANQRVSLQRAKAIKKELEQNLVPSNRIEVAGGGIAPSGLTIGEGRIAIVQNIQ